jgi:hypothetical protein
MYESREESSKITGMNNSKFANIEKNNVIGKKKGYDYSFLDDYGLIKENTELNDKMILIGKINSNLADKDTWIDDSIKPKKGQLGYVDKSFITLGEEGFNVAKVRLREERIPAIGDKMASRSGQKGTIGLIIPEADMPYLEDGTKPDLIINPHAIPSRMTIGQIVESMFGIACVSYGGFGDCTAFQVKGSNYNTYGPMLTKAGFNHTGNHIVYNGMTGEQLQANIYMGPTYYMRLKHMVKDKINYRARGPNQQLTRQPVQGRANDGGLRVGEMERDGICAHGLAYFLNESFLVRGDEYYMAVCNKTGSIAVYNEAKNLFLSPYSDGPINFHTNPDGTMNIKNLTKFGRSFSLLRIPYSFKLLIQELQVMNIHMRIITDENVDQLLSMSYSNNINKLLHNTDDRNIENTSSLIKQFVRQMEREQKKSNELYNVEDVTILPSPVVINSETSSTSPQYIDKPSSEILPTDGNAFEGYFGKNDPGNLLPGYYGVSKPLPSSPTPSSPAYVPSTPAYVPSTSSSVPSPPSYPPLSPSSPPPSSSSSYPPLSPSSPPPSTPSTILEVPKDEEKKDENNDKDSETQSDLDNKKVIEMSNQDVNNDTSTSETKKINI